MANKASNGQKSTGSVKVVFNSANGFAESGNNFEGNLKVTDDAIYAKGLQFPGGKWIGVEALADVIKEGVDSILHEIYFGHLDQTEKSEEDLVAECRQFGNAVNTLYAAFMMLGADAKEAKSLTVKYILDLDLGFEAKLIKTFLAEDSAAF